VEDIVLKKVAIFAVPIKSVVDICKYCHKRFVNTGALFQATGMPFKSILSRVSVCPEDYGCPMPHGYFELLLPLLPRMLATGIYPIIAREDFAPFPAGVPVDRADIA
jgi:hypothetical protein